MKIKRAVNCALASIPLAIGWVSGYIAKAARLGWAAIREGFDLGSKLNND